MTKLTLRAAKHKFGSCYHIAKLLDLNISTVTRWGKYIPEKHVPTLAALPPKRLERGGAR